MSIGFYIYTTHKNYNRCKSIENTWGKNLSEDDELIFITDRDYPEHNYIKVTENDTYESSVEKNIEALRYAYRKLNHDWYFFIGDDNYVFVENFRRFVSDKDTDELNVFGCVGAGSYAADPQLTYPLGGAGHLMGKASLIKLTEGINEDKRKKESFLPWADVYIGYMLNALKVKMTHSEHFFYNTPEHHKVSKPEQHICFHYIREDEQFVNLHNREMGVSPEETNTGGATQLIETPLPVVSNKIKILKAVYGSASGVEEERKDVSEVILSSIFNDGLDIQVSNSYFGDPAYGKNKVLEILYEDENGQVHEKIIEEGSILKLPEKNSERLAIFCTNNHNPDLNSMVSFSLNRIKVSAGNKVDVLTSVWDYIPDNPFPQFVHPIRESSHLNYCLQILSLLYRSMEQKEYKYVSFLEHDVLYPEGYFDYPDFEVGQRLSNTTHFGLVPEGWQRGKGDQREEALHRMTLRFSDALRHFESVVLKNALLNGFTQMEPFEDVYAILGLPPESATSLVEWSCQNPTIHVNHGHNLTNFEEIYSTENVFEIEDYWGDKMNYLHLFPEKKEETEVSPNPPLTITRTDESERPTVDV